MALSEKNQYINVILPKEFKQKIQRDAEREQRSLTAQVRHFLLENYPENED